MMNLLTNFLALFTESAPWLLLGLFIAGLMKYVLPIGMLERHMKKDNISSVVKAALIGAPLPLCSCGVIPAALGLRRAGASRSSTLSFLVATPETGVDSISVSYALLGPFMAVIRPISAITSAIVTGVCVMMFAHSNSRDDSVTTQTSSKGSGCCGKKTCKSTALPKRSSIRTTIVGIWSFSTGKLLSDITKWLLIGLVFAAMIKTYLPQEFLTQWGDGFLAMLIMALVGVPMYICASASTPIAAGLLAAGVSPGAVLVFMLAGPATNLATMGMIQQEFGKRIVCTYVFSVVSMSILFGYLTNALLDKYGFTVFQVAAPEHVMEHSFVYIGSAVLLAGLIMKNSFISNFMKKTDAASNNNVGAL